MKLAWEAAEPGRHVKGHQARRAYLDSFENNQIPTGMTHIYDLL